MKPVNLPIVVHVAQMITIPRVEEATLVGGMIWRVEICCSDQTVV